MELEELKYSLADICDKCWKTFLKVAKEHRKLADRESENS